MGIGNRSILTLAVITSFSASMASAQAPPTAPLVLSVPTSARVAALGDAWVAGRDQDVLFSNPAQLIGVRPDFSASLVRIGPSTTAESLASTYAAGKMSLTLGWGVRFVNFTTQPDQPYPYSASTLLAGGPADAQGLLATVGAAVVYKGFRIGAAGKYVSDRGPSVSDLAGFLSSSRHTWLADIGVAHNLFGGVAGLAVQNLGRESLAGSPQADIPRQLAMGWSTTRPAGPLDLGVFTQVTVERHGWTAPAAGLEAGYSWIEGYAVTLRAGVRRPESTSEHPASIGAALTADRLTVDYALEFFQGGQHAHLVTLRWR
jgi:hypothetical protein